MRLGIHISEIGHDDRAYSQHVMQRDVLGHCHDQRDFGFNSLLNCSRGLMSRYVDGSGIRL